MQKLNGQVRNVEKQAQLTERASRHLDRQIAQAEITIRTHNEQIVRTCTDPIVRYWEFSAGCIIERIWKGKK